MEQKEKHRFLFMQLVFSLHSATMQQLGKVKNPLSDKIERDLQGAQASIDMLDMIREKTKGNLTDDEERFLSQILHELRLNYVDEAGKPEPSAGHGDSSTGEKQG
ncbi:MAG TPA: DUF1844 domain-containing protein [Bacteroidota bacterium]|nr:DUF1844 domain-containing protein [Bacteroidota bacterium]